MSIKSIRINREKLSGLLEQPTEVKLQALVNHTEIVVMLANDIMEDYARNYAGLKYQREGPYEGRFDRWGNNPSRISVGAEKLPIAVPRLKDNETGKVINLPEFETIRKAGLDQDKILNALIHGVSCRDFQGIVYDIMDGMGLSRNSVSKSFIDSSTEKLKEFQERRFDNEKYIALLIDGKHLAGEQMIIAIGITEQGEKKVLDFVQSSNENSAVISELLQGIVNRGFKYQEGILVVIDGSKGIRKAVEDVFGEFAFIQRCQWHKRENVIKYLDEERKKRYKNKLQQAYCESNYHRAKEMLLEIEKELRKINISAANSLLEGLEETLTLQRLGLYEDFSRSFSTTNCIESINSQIGKKVDKVTNWQNSNQRYRWIASVLLEIEKGLHRTQGCKKLHKMREVFKTEIQNKKHTSQHSSGKE